MSDLIETLPINNKETPTPDEYNILDNYFPNNSINLKNVKLSILIAFLFITLLLIREIYLQKISINIFMPLSFVSVLVLTFLWFSFL